MGGIQTQILTPPPLGRSKVLRRFGPHLAQTCQKIFFY